MSNVRGRKDQMNQDEELHNYFQKFLENHTIEDMKLEGIDETEDKIVFNVTLRYNTPAKYISLNSTVNPLSGCREA
jgi:hypothetical protein